MKHDISIDENDLIRMGQRLTHRGPDNSSFIVYDNAGFVHTRLSILDRSEAGNQPFHDDRYVLSYNGEIYNYLELKKELKKEGMTFRSRSDTEVLFHYLIKKGVKKTLESIKGMFAFSFYDTLTKTLYLCRDRLGIKPLNWVHASNGIYWALEVKALIDIVPIEPDPIKTLISISSTGEMSGENTVFKNVKQVKPGSYLQYESGGVPKIHKYFDPIDLVDKSYYYELDNYSIESIISTFADLMDKSVKKMLMSDVPMGVFVSGGIDSSLISVFAHRHQKALKYFTANILGQFSEYSAAKLLADSIGVSLYTYEFEAEMMLRDWTRTTYYYECPIVSFPNAIPFSNVARLARKENVKPVLTGEGRDELFMGYPDRLYKNLLKYLKYPAEMLKKISKISPGLKRKLYSGSSQSLSNFIFKLPQGYEDKIIKQKAYDAFYFLPKKDIKHQALTIEMLHTPLIGLLYRNDRMGMMASIESRFPYLDEDILKFAINLPYRWKLQHTYKLYDIRHPFLVDKYLIRKMAQNILPKKLVNKRKWYFKMHGHESLIVKNGFFQGGYIQSLLGIGKQDEEQLLNGEDQSFIGKLVSVDIFGRLYGLKQKQEEINKLVYDYISLQIPTSMEDRLRSWALLR